MRRSRALHPTAFGLLAVALASAAPAFAVDEFTGYLFAYFTGNDKSQEAIRFALGEDGFNYKALNKGNPVLSSAAISATGGIRDPHILRGQNGDYYMVATDMVSAKGWNSNHGMVLLKSSNLVDWTSAMVDIRTAFPSFSSADRVWAPQTIWDPQAGKYMVYFAMRLGGSDVDKLYWAYANETFTALATTPKVLYTYNGEAAIDGDIVFDGTLYHLFFKTEGNGNGIKSATSKTLTGPYTLIDKYVQPTTKAVEGSCAFKLSNSDTWVLMYDLYMDGQYQFATSKDLQNFTVATTRWSFDFTPRHGTVIPITDKEKAALNAKWNPTSIEREAVGSLAARIVSGRLLRMDGMSGISRVAVIDPAGRTRHARILEGEETAELDLSSLSGGVYRVVSTGSACPGGCSRKVALP